MYGSTYRFPQKSHLMRPFGSIRPGRGGPTESRNSFIGPHPRGSSVAPTRLRWAKRLTSSPQDEKIGKSGCEVLARSNPSIEPASTWPVWHPAGVRPPRARHLFRFASVEAEEAISAHRSDNVPHPGGDPETSMPPARSGRPSRGSE